MIHRAAIYDPYLDTLGGGERYCLTIAEILLSDGYQVDIFWSKDKTIITKAADRFSLNLKKLNIVPDIFKIADNALTYEVPPQTTISRLPTSTLISKITELINRWRITSKYDLLVYLSDGSIPLLFAKKNYLHIQVPFKIKTSLISQFKINRLSGSIFNSNFTKSFYLPSPKNYVLYPPVDVEQFDPTLKKEKIILSVGRFDNVLNAKKQDTLISAFKKFNQQQKDWQLVLAGGSLTPEKQNSFIQHLNLLSKDLPVKIIVNPTFAILRNLYQISSIYWHAAGFGVDATIHPEATEHFGITVVEAMASGLVPIVVNQGGLPEIVINEQNGFLWHTVDQLLAKTHLLIASPTLFKQLSTNAISTSKRYSKNNFKTRFKNLIDHE